MTAGAAAAQLAQQVAQASSGMKTKLPQNMASSNKQLKASSAGVLSQHGTMPGKDDAAKNDSAAAAKEAFEQFKKRLCEAMAEERLESDANSATRGEIQVISAENACSAHKGRKISVVQPKLDMASKNEYIKKLKKVKPFSDRLAREMRSLFEELRQGAIIRHRDSGRVDGKTLSRIDIDSRIFLQKKNPLPQFTAHNIRHTFVTRLADRKIDVNVIKYLAGHSDITTTLEIYDEASTDRVNAELEGIDVED